MGSQRQGNEFERQIKALISKIIHKGSTTATRTGIDSIKLFNQHLTFDISKHFPIITGRKIFFEKAVGEFLWMKGGHTDLEFLHKYKIKWWDDFATAGKLGRVYGYQIRNYDSDFDQWEYAKNEIMNNTRRAIITLWNPKDLNYQALPCCFTEFIYNRDGDNLDMSITMRSSDVLLGLPYDIIIFALFLESMAREIGLKARTIGINLVDAHIYKNQLPQAFRYLATRTYKPPKIYFGNEIELIGYVCGKHIEIPLNV